MKPKYTRDNQGVDHFSSICPIALSRLAKIHTEGDERYGRDNWTAVTDMEKFKIDVWDHLMRHQFLYLSGDRKEDHLAKMVWGLNALMHYESKCRHRECR